MAGAFSCLSKEANTAVLQHLAMEVIQCSDFIMVYIPPSVVWVL